MEGIETIVILRQTLPKNTKGTVSEWRPVKFPTSQTISLEPSSKDTVSLSLS